MTGLAIESHRVLSQGQDTVVCELMGKKRSWLSFCCCWLQKDRIEVMNMVESVAKKNEYVDSVKTRSVHNLR